MTSRTITNQPLAASEAVAHLHDLYKVANMTCVSSKDPHYEELATDIHETIRSILQGVAPAEAVKDLVGQWRTNAAMTPDGPTAIRTYRWIGLISHMVKP